MKRPEQHIIETKSQRIFERIVPVEWVCREIKPDYGVDYLVEIFENNKSTGKTFFVQLKGSTQEIKNETFEKQITTDNLKYYNLLALPVIIICVSVTTEKIWGIWANKLIELNPLKDNQKTVSLSLGKEYQLDAYNFKIITSQTDILNKLGLSTVTDSDLTHTFNNHILRWIEYFYNQSVSVKFNNLPKHLKLIYNTNGDSIETIVSTSSYSKSINVVNFNENLPFLYRPEFVCDDINDFNKEILLSIAISLAKYDIKGSLKLLTKLISNLDFSDQNKWIELDALGLLSLAYAKNEIHLYNKFIKEIIKTEKFEMFLFFDMAYFVIGTDELQEYRIEHLKAVIKTSTDKQVQGTSHYNIGNILKSKMMDAIGHYFKAAKLYPDYKNRHYWWREIAGLLFSKKHYQWAEICYKKSVDLTKNNKEEKKYFRLEKVLPREENLVIALIADCLFLQGKFKDAHEYFEKYIKITKRPSQEWILKNMVCFELMNGKLDNITFNRKKSTQLCEQSLTLSKNKEIIKTLTKATEFHPTNGLAWFNLGVALDKELKFEEALFAFLMTGLIQDGDKEAQFNALTISFTQKKLEMMQALLIYITEKYDNSIINDLSDYIMNKNMPLKEKKVLIKAFNEMIEVTKTMHNNRNRCTNP